MLEAQASSPAGFAIDTVRDSKQATTRALPVPGARRLAVYD
jgi:hypothetical protein